MMIRREGTTDTGEALQPVRNAAGERPALPPNAAAETTEPRKRGSAMGKYRGMLSSTEEFLRRKHEEIDEEERRWT
jgi:hypothetical protein